MTYSDWLEWKANPITKLFYEACDERVEDAKEIVINAAGIDQLQDSFYRGFVYAYREMKEFRMDEDTFSEEDTLQ